MKNIKLLLATTAILSTTLVAKVMAADPGTLDDEKATINVEAEIIHARSLTATPLKFGRIVINKDNKGPITLVMSSSGVVEPDDTGAYILSQGQKGTVTGAICDELTWQKTGNIAINPPSGKSIAEANLQNISCVDNNDQATFYANLVLYNAANNAPIPEGKYSGSFIVTVISTIYDN